MEPGIQTGSVIAMQTVSDEIPEEVLFNINNMKPGDWAPRTVVIQNNGGLNFDYYVSMEQNGDSVKLYNELLLEFRDADQLLYNGKLKDFTELAPRNLESYREEALDFTIRFPEHLGNDFQGSNASSGGSADSGGSGGASLPNTAAGMFNYLLIGFILLVAGGILILYKRKLAD